MSQVARLASHQLRMAVLDIYAAINRYLEPTVKSHHDLPFFTVTLGQDSPPCYAKIIIQFGKKTG